MKTIEEQQADDAIVWLDELSVTPLRKGTGSLEKNNKFCCIGVGCKLFNLPTKTKGGKPKEWSTELQRKLGLLPYDKGNARPVWLNDIYHYKAKTFSGVAVQLRKKKNIRLSFKPKVAEIIIQKLFN